MLTVFVFICALCIAMNEPFLSRQPAHSNRMDRLPPEFLMPVPFCEFVCDQVYWMFCKCACLCVD